MGSVIAAGSSYATHGEHMIPVYVFYSMFGFQRTGDQMWAFGDQLGRGLPARRDRRPHHAERRGAAAQRRALAAARLDQPGVRRPTTRRSRTRSRYIVKDALRRMYGATAEHPDGEDIFYYLTVYNEPYPQPAAPGRSTGSTRASCAGMYRYAAAGRRQCRGTADAPRGAAARAPASAMPWALDAQRLLAEDWGVARRRLVGHLVDRAAARRAGVRLAQPAAPGEPARVPYVTPALAGAPGPVVAVSDWMRAVPDQIARWVPSAPYTSLGTDGFGCSDTRAAARRFFHVDARVDRAGGAVRARQGGRWTRRCPPRRSRSTSSTCRCRRRSARTSAMASTMASRRWIVRSTGIS